jgi:RNA polymerase sigma-70 factor, ECF subfamily
MVVPHVSMRSMASLPRCATAVLRGLSHRWKGERPWEGLPDLRLVDEARRGNQAAYGELIRRYQERIYSLVLGMLPRREEALAVTQEVFVSAYRELEQAGACSIGYARLCRLAVKACLDVRRTGPDPAMAVDELDAPLYQAIETLCEPVRTAVVLRDIAGLTPREIAEIIACPLEVVKGRIQQGRAELRGKLVPSTEASRTLCGPRAPGKPSMAPPGPRE